MIVASGASNTLVESSAPPSPVSKSNKSAGTRENANIAAAVVTSKGYYHVVIGGFNFLQQIGKFAIVNQPTGKPYAFIKPA